MDVAESNSTNSLPEEIVFDILTRLPVKSIRRFKCVSKTWISIISDPKFVESRSARFKSQSKLLITICTQAFHESRLRERAQERWYDDRRERWNEESRCIFVADQADGRSSLVLKQQLTMPVKKSLFCNMCLGISLSPGDSQSVGGLMFSVCSRELIRIANPSTNHCVAFPRSFPQPYNGSFYYCSGRQVHFVTLGFDPIEGKHKVLESRSISDNDYYEVKSTEHRVVTVGDYGNWRSVEDGPHIFERSEQEICVNGVIYYTALVGNFNTEEGRREWCMVAFHVRSEIFQVVELSIQGRYMMNLCPWRLIEFEGKVAIVDYPWSHRYYEDIVHVVELWVMEDFQNQVWSLELSALPSLLKTDHPAGSDHKLLGATSAGELAFIGKDDLRSLYEKTEDSSEEKDAPFSLVFFDIKSEDVWSSEVHLPPGFPMGGTVSISVAGHVETLLSVS